MKKCICCGIESDADELTCANCGEASWSALIAPVKPDDDSESVPNPVVASKPRDESERVFDSDVQVEGTIRRRSRKPS